MPSDTYILTISDAGVSVPAAHASSHLSGGSDPIPNATTSSSGLMSAAVLNEHIVNNQKISNKNHTGDVVDSDGVLKVTGVNNVKLQDLNTGILKNTTGTGAVSIAAKEDFPRLDQDTTGRAATATTADNLAGGALGSLPYQTGSGTTSMLSAGNAGYVLTSDGTAAPYWSPPITLLTGVEGAISVSDGGTGATSFTAGILKTNGGGSSFTTTPAPSGNVVGTSDSQTLTNKTFGNGTNLGTPASGNLSNCTSLPLSTGVSGTLSVSNGGTGSTSLTGYVRGSGTSPLSAASTIPASDISGTLAVENGGTGVSSFTGYIKGNGTSPVSTSSTIPVADIDGTIPVSKGGTGAITLNGYVKGNGTGAMTSSTVVPITDLSGLPAAGIVTSTGSALSSVPVLPVASGGTGLTVPDGYLLGNGLGGLTAVTSIPASAISGLDNGNANVPTTAGVVTSNGTVLNSVVTLPVSLGGTGATSLSGYVKGSGTGPLTTVAKIPAADIDGVVTNTAVNLATSTGVLPVANGGSGATSLTGYIKGNGTNAFSTALKIPVEDIEGDIGSNLQIGVIASGPEPEATITEDEFGNNLLNITFPEVNSGILDDYSELVVGLCINNQPATRTILVKQ